MKTGDLLISTVTRSAPTFHNPGHIRLWNDTPLRSFEPHLFTAIIIIIFIAGISYFFYFRRKGKLSKDLVGDKDDERFQELIAKKNIILKKIAQTEDDYEAGKLSVEESNEKILAYKEYLYKVKLELNQFIE